ncbi:MAG TPA: hypothetical protein VMU67_05735 [Steroidobacteraceae bacterium]|nr:hypothetical protein [Steroidobacteraceae bacterium]
MNEREFLRGQLAGERRALDAAARRIREVLASRTPAGAAGAAHAPSAAFLEASAAYFLFGLPRAAARASAQRARLRAHHALAGRIEGIVRGAAAQRAALERAVQAWRRDPDSLDNIVDDLDSCAVFIINYLTADDPELDALGLQLYTIEDWRNIAAADADSILEERRLRAAALEAQP